MIRNRRKFRSAVPRPNGSGSFSDFSVAAQSNSNKDSRIATEYVRVPSSIAIPGVLSMLADWSLSMRRSIPVALLTLLILTACATSTAQIKRDVFAYKVNSHPVISIRNQYGRITVTPSSVDRVVATVVHSDAVEILHQQNENRIEMTTGSQVATGAKADNVDYQVLVPADACVILSTAAGSLSAENLEG